MLYYKWLQPPVTAAMAVGEKSRRRRWGYVPAAVPFPNHSPAIPLWILAERRAKPMRVFEAIVQVATLLIALADLFLRVRNGHKKD
jgi:hypothetical protein